MNQAPTKTRLHGWLTISTALILAFPIGCGRVDGPPSAAGDAGPSDGPGGGDDAEVLSCPGEDVCVPAVPDGWSGPVVLLDAATHPACPEQMPVEVEVSHRTLQVGPMTCGCACGAPTDVTCSGNVVVEARRQPCDQEDLAPPIVSLPLGVVVNVQTRDSSSWSTDLVNHPLPVVTGGSCAVLAESSIPEPAWTDELRTCAPDPNLTPDACDGNGTCLSAMVEELAPICIYQEGDTSCPAGPFSERTVTFREIEDTRACSACTCGPLQGTCDGEVRFNTSNGRVDFELDGCIDFFSSAKTAEFNTRGMTATCQASSVTASGAAVPSGAVTTCCLPAGGS